jgi:hypothetical protein
VKEFNTAKLGFSAYRIAQVPRNLAIRFLPQSEVEVDRADLLYSVGLSGQLCSNLKIWDRG